MKTKRMVYDQESYTGKVQVGSIVCISVSPLNPTQFAGDERTVIVSRILGQMMIASPDEKKWDSSKCTLIEATPDDDGVQLVGWLTSVKAY